jgi:hypothetical protein
LAKLFVLKTDVSDICGKELAEAKELRGGGQQRLVLIRKLEFSSSARPNPLHYSNVHDIIPELILTCCLQWIPAENVGSIAFVFHIDSIQHGKYLCSGMRNAYFLRKLKDEVGKEIAVEEDHWEAFNSNYL